MQSRRFSASKHGWGTQTLIIPDCEHREAQKLMMRELKSAVHGIEYRHRRRYIIVILASLLADAESDRTEQFCPLMVGANPTYLPAIC